MNSGKRRRGVAADVELDRIVVELHTLRRGMKETLPTSRWLAVRLDPFLEGVAKLPAKSPREREVLRRVMALAWKIALIEHGEYLSAIGARPPVETSRKRRAALMAGAATGER